MRRQTQEHDAERLARADRHTEQDDIQVGGDETGGLGDALPGGPDCFLRPGTRVAASPARHIRPRIDRGIHAEPGRDDAGDRVSLDLLDTAASGGTRSGQATEAGVGQHVAEFVNKRPGGGWRVQLGTHPDSVSAPPGLAVAHAVTPLDRESFAPGQPGEGVPQSRQHSSPVGQRRCGNVRIGRPAGLGDIPDVSELRSALLTGGTGSGISRLRMTVVCESRAGFGDELDARFTLADLPALVLPFFVAGQEGRGGLLRRDQHDVGEAPGGEALASGPGIPFSERCPWTAPGWWGIGSKASRAPVVVAFSGPRVIKLARMACASAGVA